MDGYNHPTTSRNSVRIVPLTTVEPIPRAIVVTDQKADVRNSTPSDHAHNIRIRVRGAIPWRKKMSSRLKFSTRVHADRPYRIDCRE